MTSSCWYYPTAALCSETACGDGNSSVSVPLGMVATSNVYT